ncbi:MAG: biotin/lipoyl-containing protein [Sulfolobales archaeon]
MSKTYSLRVNDRDYTVEVSELGDGKFKVRFDGKELIVELIQKKPTIQTTTMKYESVLVKEEGAPQIPLPSGGVEVITAPVPGKVVKVLVSPGDTVKDKAVVLTLESMKMELEIVTPTAGVVKEVRVKPGDSVNVGDVLVIISKT